MMTVHATTEPARAPATRQPPTVLRRCACGGGNSAMGECAACRRARQRSATLNRQTDFTVRRQPDGKAKSNEEKLTEAAKKTGEAFLETGVGKDLKKQATELGKDFVSSLPGKVITGAAAAGAVSYIVAKNSELPIGIPEIPLDSVASGLKMKITWEGPVRTPKKAMLTFTWSPGAPATKKAAPTEREKFRAETARMAKEQADFRESMKPKEQRAAENEAFWTAYRSGMGRYGLRPLQVPGLDQEKKEDETPVLRRTASGSAAPQVAPPDVHGTIGRSGAPLPAGLRADFESRFGRDFGHVRIHTDSRAAESADLVGARAYTVGSAIVFGPGRWAPGTADGRQLLAHELAHVAQYDAGRDGGGHDLEIGRIDDPLEAEADALASRALAGSAAHTTHSTRHAPGRVRRATLRRAWDWRRAGYGALAGGGIGAAIGGIASIFLGPAAILVGLGVGALAGALIGGLTGDSEPDSTVTVEEPTGPNDCKLAQHRRIFPAVHRSLAWVRAAVARLRAFIARPDQPENQPVRGQLQRHFRSASPDVSNHVAGRLQRIHDDMTTRRNFTVECHDTTDTSCSSAAAYVAGPRLVFCPGFFRNNDGDWQAEALIHEWAHALNTGVHITDRAYSSDRLYDPAIARGLTTAEALTNAESYSVFARELATGRQVNVGGPRDEVEGCVPAGEQAIRAAVARAQRINRNAQVATADARPTWLAGWQDLQNTHLGGTTPAHIAAARRVYDATGTRLGAALDIACDTDAGRCAGRHRIDNGAIRLCPAWFALSEPDRVVAVLEAMYEAHAAVGNAAQRTAYAALARDLNDRYWRAPALAAVIAGGV